MTKISPTLLCADPLTLDDTISRLNSLDIAWYHVDIMDGHFVPNLAFGLLTLQSICQNAQHPVCAHFMVENPQDYVEFCSSIKLDYFTFHTEAERNPFRLIQKIRHSGMKAGIAINPITPVYDIKELLPLVDMVTVMAVEPGFSGQTFLDLTYQKLRELNNLKINNNFFIEVDGGVTMENAAVCASCGADVLVGGAFTIFREKDTLENNFNQMNHLLEQMKKLPSP